MKWRRTEYVAGLIKQITGMKTPNWQYCRKTKNRQADKIKRMIGTKHKEEQKTLKETYLCPSLITFKIFVCLITRVIKYN